MCYIPFVVGIVILTADHIKTVPQFSDLNKLQRQGDKHARSQQDEYKRSGDDIANFSGGGRQLVEK